MTGNTVVIGIGNTLLMDDGVGVHAVDAIKLFINPNETVKFIDGGTLSFTLIDYFNSFENVIIIDATNLHLNPGSYQIFVNDEVNRFLSTYSPGSVHDVNLLDVLKMAHLIGCFPKKLALVAIQPERVTWGTELSPAIKKVLPNVSESVNQLLKQWSVSYA